MLHASASLIPEVPPELALALSIVAVVVSLAGFIVSICARRETKHPERAAEDDERFSDSSQ